MQAASRAMTSQSSVPLLWWCSGGAGLRLGVQAGGLAAVALGEEAIGAVSWSRELGWVPEEGPEVVPGGPSISQSTNTCEIHPKNGRC